VMGNAQRKKQKGKPKKSKKGPKKDEEQDRASKIPEDDEVGEKKEGEIHPFRNPRDHILAEERPLHNLSRITHFDVVTIRNLKRIFTEISQSKVDDGIIDLNELTEAMGLKTTSPLAKTLFRLFDVTQTKRINFRTWVTTLSALSREASLDDKIKFSFALYDQNSDGVIEKAELQSLLIAAVRENVVSLTPAQVEEIVSHTLANVDRDKNGTVDYKEYEQMVKDSPKIIEAFTVDVAQICETYKRVRSRNSLHIHEEDARKQREGFRERYDKKDVHSDRSEDLQTSSSSTLDKPAVTRKRSHAPSEKELDLDAQVVDQRKLSELFDSTELQAAVASVTQVPVSH
jgi:serine/threonine-protein phosphatase 2B regulatory subunit